MAISILPYFLLLPIYYIPIILSRIVIKEFPKMQNLRGKKVLGSAPPGVLNFYEELV